MTRIPGIVLAVAFLFQGSQALAGPSGRMGVGLAVGGETQLTAKYRFDREDAVDAALSGEGGLVRFHSDYLYEAGALASSRTLVLAPYLGAGGVLDYWNASTTTAPGGKGGTTSGSSAQIGLAARVPLGLDLRFRRLPRLEVFGELAYQVALTGPAESGWAPLLGVRWFF